VGSLGVESYQNPDDGDGVCLCNVGLLEPCDVVESPRRFY
jgi:hypothetical protein